MGKATLLVAILFMTARTKFFTQYLDNVPVGCIQKRL